MQNVEYNVIGVHQNSHEDAELSIPLQFQDVCPLCGIGVNMAQSLVHTYHDAQDKSLCFHVFCLHLCPTCHTAIHSLFTTRELASRFNSLELIKKDFKIVKYLKFIENVPGDSYVPIKNSRRVRKSS